MSGDGGGFWEPHSSSIDFCESNYLHSNWLVEPHNVWSSFLGLSMFGLLGLWQTTTPSTATGPLQEWRVKLSCIILILTGLGSCCLHGTLHWFFQSSDELPMIYLTLSLLYTCAEVDAVPGKQNYPWLAPGLILTAVGNTIVYFTFQDLWWVFLLTFISASTATIGWMFYLVFLSSIASARERLVVQRTFKAGAISYMFVGGTSWVLDMLYCDKGVLEFADTVMPGYLRGLTPHVLWHFAAGHGAYCGIINLACIRCLALGIPFSVKFFAGCLPLIQQHHHPKDN
jgi:dihydroceramidase